jgi:hypothetical protein
VIVTPATRADQAAVEFPARELTAWMDERDLGAGPISDVAPLAGGTQNILVRFRRGSDRFVFRRPPLAKRANSDETMRREATVLGALRDSAVPHPDLIAHEPVPSLIGAAFYLMEPIDGITAGAGLRALEAQPGAKARLGLAMADGLAALATVDHLAVGLGGFGRAAYSPPPTTTTTSGRSLRRPASRTRHEPIHHQRAYRARVRLDQGSVDDTVNDTSGQLTDDIQLIPCTYRHEARSSTDTDGRSASRSSTPRRSPSDPTGRIVIAGVSGTDPVRRG